MKNENQVQDLDGSIYRDIVKKQKHPCLLIQAATSYYRVDERTFRNMGKVARCVHREPFSYPIDFANITAYVRCTEIAVQMDAYMFDWSEQLGWMLEMWMGLCSCGKLFVMEYGIHYSIEYRDAYGPGRHQYRTTKVRV